MSIITFYIAFTYKATFVVTVFILSIKVSNEIKKGVYKFVCVNWKKCIYNILHDYSIFFDKNHLKRHVFDQLLQPL